MLTHGYTVTHYSSRQSRRAPDNLIHFKTERGRTLTDGLLVVCVWVLAEINIIIPLEPPPPPGWLRACILQDSSSVDGALDSKIAAATVRKIAKLSSEAGGSEKFESSGRLPYAIVATTKSDRYT